MFLTKLLHESQFFPALVIVPDVVKSKALRVHLAIFVDLSVRYRGLIWARNFYHHLGYLFVVCFDL